MSTLTPQDFVSKWKRVAARERQTYQEHFIDRCHLVEHQTPNDYDPTGTRFGFEMGADSILYPRHPRPGTRGIRTSEQNTQIKA